METTVFTTAAGQLAALATLMATSAWLGLSDWRSRTIGYSAIRICYVAAIAVNVLPFVMVVMAEHHPAGSMAGAIGELITNAVPTATIIALLSGIIVMFWKLGLLASGDAYAVPAFLSMLLFVTAPAMVAVYFITAIAITAVIFVAKNIRNNMRHRSRLYGPLWHRLYLMLFCYYGNGSDVRYAFAYDGGSDCTGIKIKRDYDEEPFYQGKEKTWLVPGLPLLSGFAPATAMLFFFFLLPSFTL